MRTGRQRQSRKKLASAQPSSMAAGTDGGWRVTDGGWRVTDGGWRVTDGSWRVTDGSWRVTDSGLTWT